MNHKAVLLVSNVQFKLRAARLLMSPIAYGKRLGNVPWTEVRARGPSSRCESGASARHILTVYFTYKGYLMSVDTRAFDWSVRWLGNVEALGATYQLFRFESAEADIERKVRFVGYGQRLGATIGANAKFSSERLNSSAFSLDDLNNRKGEVLGLTVGTIFQAAMLFIYADGLFKRQTLRAYGLGLLSAGFQATGVWNVEY